MNSKRLVKDYTFLFSITGVIVALDQITKIYIRANFIPYVDMWSPWPWLMPYARIIHVHNTGVAFGMFQGMGYVFAVLAAIVSLVIIYYFPRVPVEERVLRLAMSLQLAGALGNLIDRITQGGIVTDFISVGDFPVFNVADSSITIGVVILIVGVWLQERQQKAEQERQKLADAQGESRQSAPSLDDESKVVENPSE